ncbi:hypothetical protein ACFQVD_26640 [Streptosporangium amethystogenes subsp. fukuiense]|uniref:Uncharacterized protein n=1 Tax=Streptosporangium amethystogenes subsp. fukuiense TaxID=698418 RepID=A0ABW2T5J6_9ACTN
MKMRLIVTGEYDVTDDPAERQRIYGATDPFECAKVDAENSAEDLLALADRIISRDVHPALSAENGESDPAKLSDDDLIFAMGIHDDDCPCAYCAEWQRRRAIRDDERRKVAEEIRSIAAPNTGVVASDLREFIARLGSFSGIDDVLRAIAAEIDTPAAS